MSNNATSNREVLNKAVRSGEPERVRAVLSRGLVDINAIDENGNTALHWAVMGGYLDIVKLLLANGADPNAHSERGVTPLWSAKDFGLQDIIAELSRNGAEE